MLARRHLDELRELESLLHRDVGARGVLLLDQFLTSPASPLYARERAAAFGRSVDEIRHEFRRS